MELQQQNARGARRPLRSRAERVFEPAAGTAARHQQCERRSLIGQWEAMGSYQYELHLPPCCDPVEAVMAGPEYRIEETTWPFHIPNGYNVYDNETGERVGHVDASDAEEAGQKIADGDWDVDDD